MNLGEAYASHIKSTDLMIVAISQKRHFVTLKSVAACYSVIFNRYRCSISIYRQWWTGTDEKTRLVDFQFFADTQRLWQNNFYFIKIW